MKSNNRVRIFLIIIILMCMMAMISLVVWYQSNRFFTYQLQQDKTILSKKPILLKDLTNFDWDYALLYTGEDFQNIKFYKNNQLVFKENIDLDYEGNFNSQVGFSTEAYCTYHHGKIIFNEKVHLGHNKFFYDYKPVDCQSIPKNL